MPHLTPLERPVKLAGNPASNPTYSKDVVLASGETISLPDPQATRAMVALMDMQAVMGGAASHFGGPAAFAEIMSAVYGLVFYWAKKNNRPWYNDFHVINDAGHCENGLYALKANFGVANLSLDSLKGFRSIESVLTGHGESHLFPEGVYLSNGPLGSSLPQSQGLAFADALAGVNRVIVTAISDGACMEGEAKEALAAIPGLAAKGQMAPFVLVISDNNTKLSGRIDEESFSMAPTFASLKELGWQVLELKDGHDLQACAQVFDKAVSMVRNNPRHPVALHVHTIKGYGTKATEASSSGAHGFPLSNPNDLHSFLSEIYDGDSVPAEFIEWARELVNTFEVKKSASKNSSSKPKDKVQTGVAKALIRKAQEGLPVVSVSSDLAGSTGVKPFQKEFPHQSLDVGVAEANMLSMAAGLSKQGYIPVVDTFAQFGVTKGGLPLIMASLSEAPVIAIYSHVGFQDAADGASHQALTYFSMASSIPHVDVYNLTSSNEADALVGQAIDRWVSALKQGEVPRSQIFFLGRETFPETYLSEGYQYQLGRAQVIRDIEESCQQKVTIVASGALLGQALQAADALSAEGIEALVVNPSVINRPDVETIAQCLSKTNGLLLTVEDHQLIGGMGSLLVHALVNEGVSVNARSLGVKDEFGQSAYKALELYAKHGLDSSGITQAVKALLN